MTPRPDSLAELARRALEPSAFSWELADFLHEFALRGNPAMLAEPPVILRDRYESGSVHDAWLGAVAVSLCARLAVRRRFGHVNRSAPCPTPGSLIPARICARCCWWKAPPLFANGICSSPPMRFRLRRLNSRFSAYRILCRRERDLRHAAVKFHGALPCPGAFRQWNNPGNCLVVVLRLVARLVILAPAFQLI